MQQQIRNLMAQVDMQKGSVFFKEQELNAEIKMLRLTLQEMQEKVQEAQKVAPNAQPESDSTSKWQLKYDQLCGKSLEGLEMWQLEELEAANHNAISEIAAMKQKVMLEKIKQLQKMNEQLQEEKLCSICVEHPIDLVILPCKHR